MNSKPSFTTNWWTSFKWLLAALALALIVPARAQTFSDADWASLNSLPGANNSVIMGPVSALAVSGTNPTLEVTSPRRAGSPTTSRNGTAAPGRPWVRGSVAIVLSVRWR